MHVVMHVTLLVSIVLLGANLVTQRNNCANKDI